MALKDNIKASITARANEDMSVEIEEWGDEEGGPAVVHYHPITAGEVDRIARIHKGFPAEWTFESMIDLIVLKSLDENGEKLFDKGDKPILRREKAKIISKLAGALMANRDVSSALGNLDETDLDES